MTTQFYTNQVSADWSAVVYNYQDTTSLSSSGAARNLPWNANGTPGVEWFVTDSDATSKADSYQTVFINWQQSKQKNFALAEIYHTESGVAPAGYEELNQYYHDVKSGTGLSLEVGCRLYQDWQPNWAYWVVDVPAFTYNFADFTLLQPAPVVEVTEEID